MLTASFDATADGITPGFLGDIFMAHGLLGVGQRIKAVVPARLGGSGLVGRLQRYEVQYHNLPEGCPRSIIVKQTSPDLPEGAAMAATEARFYQSEIHSEAGIRVPKIYFCTADDADRTLIILEDLGDDGFTSQLDGCTSQQAVVALSEVALLHARWWGAERYANWLRPPASSDITAFSYRWLRAYQGSWPELFGGIPKFLLENFDEIAGALGGGVRSIVHGDFHCQNICFGRDHKSVVLLDFQFVQVGSPMLDVARLLATSLTTATRRACEEELLQSYFSKLRSNGVPSSGLSALETDLRIGLVWNLVVPLALHVRKVITEGTTWPTTFPILDRCVAAIEDWDALRAVASK